MEKTIGILGGMGPLATADLFRKITLLTDAACDNEHIRVYIDSNARIPDRTAAILSGGPDPVPEMASAKTCAKDFPGQTAAILATKGTLATGLYEKALNAQGVHCLVPDEGEQDVLMHLIYDVVKASKPLEPEQGAWQALLDGLRARGADYFILGCTELPIVADTLPQAGPFVDPTAELAKAAIRFCGYRVKE